MQQQSEKVKIFRYLGVFDLTGPKNFSSKLLYSTFGKGAMQVNHGKHDAITTQSSESFHSSFLARETASENQNKQTQENFGRVSDFQLGKFSPWNENSLDGSENPSENFHIKFNFSAETRNEISSIFSPRLEEKSFHCILLQRVVALVSTRS